MSERGGVGDLTIHLRGFAQQRSAVGILRHEIVWRDGHRPLERRPRFADAPFLDAQQSHSEMRHRGLVVLADGRFDARGRIARAADTALKIAQSEIFRERQRRTRAGAAAVAEELLAAGVNVLTGGTDVHLALVDLRESVLDGQQAEDRLHDVGITVNRNAVPFDPRPPAVSSGLRVGTPALATRGFDVDEFREVGKVIGETLTASDWNDEVKSELTERTRLWDGQPATE